MTKLNGIPMIPFGLLSGFCSGQEIRITELSEEGFSFRVPEKMIYAFLIFRKMSITKCGCQKKKDRWK